MWQKTNTPTAVDKTLVEHILEIDGTVAKSSANMLIGTEFGSRCRFQPRVGF